MHAVLAVNPFDVLLRWHQQKGHIDRDFSFWLRTFRDPPIRTTATLIDACPRVDWLFWYLEILALLEELDTAIVLKAGRAVREHLDAVARGACYSARRGGYMPHTEGLRILRSVLQNELRERH